MKPRHKIALGGTIAALATLLTVGLEIWKQVESDWKAHVAADNQSAFNCEVRLCEARGGRFWRGECRSRRR